MCVFEVDYLCNYKRIRNQEYFLVKWKGYSDSENSWEPHQNLRCTQLLKQFYHDLKFEASRISGRQPRDQLPCKLKAVLVKYVVQKALQRKSLKRWERTLNTRRAHKGTISVENEVDLDEPPWDFTYINELMVAKGITMSQMAVGCKCKNCLLKPVKGCCPGISLTKFAYNVQGQVLLKAGQPIYECNNHCRCSIDCANRVVQKGIFYNLCIFRTNNGRGWGVRTLEKILNHTFVMEYMGEIITSEEAEQRGKAYDRQGTTYLFDLDYVEDVYTVDGAQFGNISHFLNHSCSPNLQVYNVFINNVDQRMPRIAFFATRNIQAGEELTFDYHMQGSSKKRVRIECKCGSKFCRKYLF
ncbi:histone-lysine N-methyltransferase SUV39H1 [Macrotis lagotis]|uniref:histone-lysine N-methyltransferase SUV39H1 n=1 Tax=Macrotis lagotis TaxID=92651 RepID=UPI003D696C60